MLRAHLLTYERYVITSFYTCYCYAIQDANKQSNVRNAYLSFPITFWCHWPKLNYVVANADTLKGQRLGIQRLIERLVEKLQDNDHMQIEPTIAALETQLVIIKRSNEMIISLADAVSTLDELLDSQIYVFDTEAKLRRYSQNLRDHPSLSRAVVYERSHPSFKLQPPAISEASKQYTEYQEYMFVPGENVNQSSLPEIRAFQQPRQVATHISVTQPPHQCTHFHQLPKLSLPTFCGDVLSWQAFWDIFESAIHLNGSLTDVQRFNYLKTMVDGEAAGQ